MELLYKDREKSEQDFIREICNWTLNQEILYKYQNPDNNWAFIFVEGRPEVEINKLEHLACFHSCKVFSQSSNTPVLCFVNNTDNFLNNDKELIYKYNIQIIKIDPITSNAAYSKFCIEKLYLNLIPENYEHLITVSADSWLLKNGVEDFILKNNWKFIGAPYKHLPSMEVLRTSKSNWESIGVPVYGFNGGASYRNHSYLKWISATFKDLNLREKFSNPEKFPNEDLFYNVIITSVLGSYSIPTYKDALQFACDPLTVKIWNDKNNLPFIYHYIKTVSEFDNN